MGSDGKPPGKIAVHGVPRSGTSWLGEIVNSSPHICYRYQPLFSYRFKGALDVESDQKAIDQFFDDIANIQDDFTEQVQARAEAKMPNFEKESIEVIAYKEVRYHNILENLLKKSDVKLVLIIRNPLEVLSSWKNAPREFRADLGWDFDEEWRGAQSKNQGREEEYFGYDRWKEAAMLFHQLKHDYPDRVFLINYDELTEKTIETVQGLFSFMGFSISEQTKDFIFESQNKNIEDTYSVYRKEAGTKAEWKSALPSIITETIINDLKDTELRVYIRSALGEGSNA